MKAEDERKFLSSQMSGRNRHGLKREMATYQCEALERELWVREETIERANAAMTAIKKEFSMAQCHCCGVALTHAEENEFGHVFCQACEYSVVRCGKCVVHDSDIYPEISVGVPALQIEQIPEWLVPRHRTLTAKQLEVIAANRAFVEAEDREKERAAELARIKEQGRLKAQTVAISYSSDEEKDE